MALDPAIRLELIELTDEGRASYSETLGKLSLGELSTVAGQMAKRSPACLAETQRFQPPVELRSPNASEPHDPGTKQIDGFTHAANEGLTSTM